MNPVLTIIIIAIAGPVIGSLIGVIKKPSNRFMFNMLAFAAGTMLAVSFLQLIPESIKLSSILICSTGVILGALIMFAADKIIPHINPEFCSQEPGHRLKRTAIYLIIGIFLHNFPEGMAMGLGSVTAFRLSLLIALAIAIHDIPEGICTSAPYFFVTKKRLKTFLVSTSTAVPTIIGFLSAYYIFPQVSLMVVGLITAMTAGLMIYIIADELIPSSCCKMTDHTTIFSLVLGVLLVILLGLI